MNKIFQAGIEGHLTVTARRFLLRFLKLYLGKIPKAINFTVSIAFKFILSKITPINPNLIYFSAGQGRYVCQPRFVYEELIKRNKPYEIAWDIGAKENFEETPNAYKVTRGRIANFKAQAAAKVWVVNGETIFLHTVPKKKGQVVIHIWHGSLGIKRFGIGLSKTGGIFGASYRLRKTIRYFDYNVSNSDFEDEVYRSTVWKDTPVLRYGHPRNDCLLRQHGTAEYKAMRYENTKKIIRTPSGADIALSAKPVLQGGFIPQFDNAKVCLYAPTFRDNSSTAPYEIDWDKLLDALCKRFGGNWVVFVRLHPRLRSKKKKLKLDNDRVFDVTAHPDITDLLLVTSCAITDYSSWIYDFVLTRRPGFIFAADLENYYTERGFFYPLTETPFPIAQDNQELEDNILNFDEEGYKDKVEAFLKARGCMEDGHASERVVDKIIEIMDGEKSV